MTPIARPSARRWRSLPFVLALAWPWAAGAADSVAGQFAEWSGTTPVTRELSLRELGFAQPLVLAGRDDRRELYLPVPAGVPTAGAELALEARYLRGHPGRSALQLAVDGDPVFARTLTDAQGDAGQMVGIDGLPRDSGFVRFGIGWWSVVSEQRCADQGAPGNTLRVSPDSRFRYRFDAAAVDTVAKAWGALPGRVRVLVEGRRLAAPAYDAAWRIGAVIENAGRRTEVVALPAVGDRVALAGAAVPESLRTIPAFAALAAGGEHRLASAAEVGALLALGQTGPLAVDVVIADDALRAAATAALDALAVEVAATGPDAAAAYAHWRAQAMSAFAAGSHADLAVARAGGLPVLVAEAAAAARVAGLLDAQWRAYAQGQALTVAAAEPVQSGQYRVRLDRFGAMSGSLEVATRADRSIAFDLGAVAADGRLPEEVVLDLAGAPNAADEGVVVSVFFNDYLLGARVLERKGQSQRIRVPVPGYALAARNQVRVSFLRQPERRYCHDPVTAYPVSILPGSHIRLGRGRASGFAAAAAQLAGPYQLRLPQAWLDDAPASLSKVIRVANAVGASPLRAELVVDDTAGSGAFLSFAAAVEPGKDGRLVLAADGRTVLDLGGLRDAAVVEVVEQGGQAGVSYREFGAPRLESPFRLVRGSVALLDGRGLVQDYDAQDPSGARLAEEGNPEPAWQKHMVWLLVLVGAVAFLLLIARVAQVRRRRAASKGH